MRPSPIPHAADKSLRQIEILEVSPRDGLQNDPTLVSTRDKLKLVLGAVEAGARRIEATSFVNPRKVPQMADASELMAALRGEGDLRAKGVKLGGLVLNLRGAERALAADVDELNYIVVASETFNQRNQGCAIEETLRQMEETARAATVPFSVTIGAAFGCPFEGEVDRRRVVDLAVAASEAGAWEVALADTIGVADPLAVEELLALVAAAAPQAALRCHLHNTRNTGIANAFAAWRAGARTLDASIGGIGGCPFAPKAAGNISTEDTVYMFQRMGVATGYDLEQLIDLNRWLGEILGFEPPAMVAKAGGFPKGVQICSPVG